jgi:diguanylate cyclase (GGDEF)-like protein
MSGLLIAVYAAVLVGWCVAVWAWFSRRSQRSGAGPRLAALGDSDGEPQLLLDELTKLPSRSLFRDRLEGALARSVRRRSSCAVLSVDLDRFKLINDSLGHAVGDALLRETATRLDGCLRPEDSLGRTGSDEFMVLVESVRGPDEAIAVAGRIEEALAPPFEVAGHELYVTASIGIALGRGGRDRAEDVLQNADVAVHRAKDGGRARHEVFRQEMSPHPFERLGLESDLRRAVKEREFFLEYQPNVELPGGRPVGVEALVRWRHPEQGVLQAAEFVPVAEETGLILPLSRWLLAEACREGAAWSGVDDLRLSVNLSSRQLLQPRARLIDEVASALAGARLVPRVLCLEITERAIAEDPDAGIAAAEALKGLGVGLALDDFGTGHSSLDYLRRLPLDVVKIDRAFVAALDPEGEAIVRALAEMCHAIGATVLAEGIETAEQARRLRALGCDLGQGIYFSPPLGAEEIGALLRSGGSLAPAGAGPG